MIRLSLGSIFSLFVIFLAAPHADEQPSRIVSLGGSVTEIVYALGEGDRLVARDTTSNYPPEANDLPDVGYIRRLSAEGVLSVDPDLILAEEGAGPPEVVAQLHQAGVPMVDVVETPTVEAIREKILTVGKALGMEADAKTLADKVMQDLETALETPVSAEKRVLFVLSMQGGRIMASGQDTAADGMIELVGATNAMEGFSGYKTVTGEAVIAAAPDVILMMDRSGDHAMANDDLFAHPAIATTPAGENRAVIRMDGMRLLGFSVRTPEAAQELIAALNGLGS
ncbi:hemin ABC transporter substrate-binding protein [Phaeobacter sp. 22II1-1F12B]|uniref:heme/hemin ABC transporter substrate-binding protein n=1 Tax=Phaeobacter sp. 22II1-1F12B TaxID=1317111 RepID=UPI000B520C5A|nr:hemin ABC transporter substrate-binding protein [Phaeobacter sp. 22II1-1F12B]OWU73137.1 hemin ABC transporter substrate-binding protein [Phaeobacter sp. 22II1-1F12B]